MVQFYCKEEIGVERRIGGMGGGGGGDGRREEEEEEEKEEEGEGGLFQPVDHWNKEAEIY